ncbi:hypothetical protein SAOR_11820 [Salinisphaera orenii MK-B5]|uniref:Cell division coordinator CpoB n=1 Tax=Salinisphaera orenii MK-B5 TaxID=856730 RepID=A0A423PJT1_9GAMM|nr:hypothetical protein SAOR_11820 [Salinisphaera orenii MK-B5]
MRHALSIAVVTGIVAVSAGLNARPAVAAPSDMDQPVRVAQNSSGGPNVFSLLQDIQRLQEQVRDLRGQIDTLQYKLRQSEQGQRDLYQNLDKRLSALEDGGAARGNDASDEFQPIGESDAGAGSDSGGSYGSSGGGYGSTGQDDTGRSASSGSDSGAAEQAYTAAFDELKNGKYDAAISGFEDFLDAHPESRYSDNAWYWLGEANYVKRNYDAALEAFRTVVNRFKASDKVAGSLYKIGVIQDEQGEADNARGTLQRVIDQYPDDNAAELARKRLDAIGG